MQKFKEVRARILIGDVVFYYEDQLEDLLYTEGTDTITLELDTGEFIEMSIEEFECDTTEFDCFILDKTIR